VSERAHFPRNCFWTVIGHFTTEAVTHAKRFFVYVTDEDAVKRAGDMKKLLIRLLLIVPVTLVATGCATSHSTPRSNEPQTVVGQTMTIWADQDGTFYPANWRQAFDAPERLPVRSAYSLLAMSSGNEPKHELRRQKIVEAERSVISQFRAFVADKRRVFFLLHGFNNNQDEAKQAYDAIRQRVAFKGADGVVEFYWDGLTAGVPRAGSIWFKAAGNSQLVGSRALRKLFNATRGKHIILIGHSRGASVFLSALRNPPYDQGFVDDTERSRPGLKVNGEPKLQPNGNNIGALLLAPAVGRDDFMSSDRKQSMRTFDTQLETVHYSVNSRDPVLNKFVGLGKYLNPTDLGLDAQLAAKIDGHDNRFNRQVWQPVKNHGFVGYVENVEFVRMLKSMNIDVR
jgi:hypothetical protein